MRPFYRLPLQCAQLTRPGRHPLLSQEEAIRQHIHLLLRTHYHGCRYDPAYGCYVWDKDFDNIQSIHRWKDELEELVRQTIGDYERRLSAVVSAVTVDELPVADPKTGQVNRFSKRITITIEGTITQTNQPMVHREYMFFSPLSLA